MAKEWHIDTKCIQEGWKPGNGEPRVRRSIQSTTFKYDDAQIPGRFVRFEDSRGLLHPFVQSHTNAVENKIAALEGGVGALLTSAGQAASLIAVLNIAHSGDHIISGSAHLRGHLQSVQ